MRIGKVLDSTASPLPNFKSIIGTNTLKPLTTVVPVADRPQRDLNYIKKIIGGVDGFKAGKLQQA